MVHEILAPIIDFAVTKPNDKEILDAERSRMTRVMTVEDTPWPYMLVCKAWHEIISSTPILWSAFFALIFDEQYSNISHLRSLLEVHLHRSKHMPITICVLGQLEDHDFNSILLVVDLVDQVFSQQHRWEDVHLDIRVFSGNKVDALMKPRRAPLNLTVDLKKTALLRRMDHQINVWSAFCESQRLVLAQCNTLEILRLGHNMEILIPNPITSHVPAYLPNLRSLSLYSSQLDASWTVLGASPNIIDLTLNVECSGSIPDMSPLSLSKLHSLTLNLWPLLEHMDLPSLNDLYLLQLSFNDGSLFEMAGLLYRHPLNALTLLISNVTEPLSERALDAVLRSLNQLKHLFIGFSDDGGIRRDSVFRMLTLVLSRPPPGDQSPVLPRLTSLHLKVSPSSILVKNGISSIIGDVILACKRRFSSGFRVLIICDSWWDGEPCDGAERSLFEEMHRCQCVTKTFRVSVNHNDVGMGHKTDPET